MRPRACPDRRPRLAYRDLYFGLLVGSATTDPENQIEGAIDEALRLTAELWRPVLEAAGDRGELAPAVVIDDLIHWIMYLELILPAGRRSMGAGEERLSKEELIANSILLYLAGHETAAGGTGLAVLALHRNLPNFRTEVTLKELEDLTSVAEELDFDSVWTLDRIVVPESSDRMELKTSFGQSTSSPVACRWPPGAHGSRAGH